MTFAKIAGLTYNIDGYGKIVECSLKAGDVIDKNIPIYVVLEE